MKPYNGYSNSWSLKRETLIHGTWDTLTIGLPPPPPLFRIHTQMPALCLRTHVLLTTATGVRIGMRYRVWARESNNITTSQYKIIFSVSCSIFIAKKMLFFFKSSPNFKKTLNKLILLRKGDCTPKMETQKKKNGNLFYFVLI